VYAILLTLGFWLLLPFFALLIWLHVIAYPKQLRYSVNLAAISLLCAMLCCAIGTYFAAKHQIWPYVQGAVAALFAFLLVFGAGWWFGHKRRTE
jgi:NADH:ubiquinone oxidoreductase subunit 6 (subunit J)